MIGYAKPIAVGIPIIADFTNLYRRHARRAIDGGLLHCPHGWSCGNDGVERATPPVLKYPRWMICVWCALADPIAYLKWRFGRS